MSHYNSQLIAKAITLILSLLLIGCSGSSAGESNINQINDRQLFKQFLYSNSQASLEYFPDWNKPLDGAIARSKFISSGIDASGYNVSLVRISYLNTNLPQFAIHISSSKNNKLLVYNHGHAGLPSVGEDFAKQFIRNLLEQGFDVLITSMPLVGLNAIDSKTKYWAKVYGHSEPTYIDNGLMTLWPHFHAIYETIDEKDHYMHFFVDSAIIFPSLMDGASDLKLIDDKKVSGLPAKKYGDISYVGLSGGGGTGLAACAIFRFKKCILVSGFLPMYLRLSNVNSWGDAEQITRSFYSIFPYEKLMELASTSSKSIVYIYNRLDPCCFADPEASRFRMDFPNYDVRVLDGNYHGFDSNYIINELTK